MGDQITRLLVHDKFSIFKKDTKRKEIIFTYPRIDEECEKCYVELKLKEGQDSYYIRERSLGFRWFFTFLLFTQFRIARLNTASNIFFLFDEPASNLHQTSQSRLLNALEDLADQAPASVIYSTHSHHMIDPKCLESTFIVRNVSLDYENEDEYTSSMTDIKIERYRTFVAKNPSSTSYFQPILDVLEYRPSNLEFIPNVVLVEGKNDYYTLSYFNEVIFSNSNTINLCPGSGSGSLDNAIRLYYAWGKNFIILLDADTEGITQKKRYNDLFGKIIEGKIYCLNDINSNWVKKGIEKLISDKDRLTLQQAVFPTTNRYKKKSCNIAIQELLVTKRAVNLSTETKKNFKQIFAFLNNRLNT